MPTVPTYDSLQVAQSSRPDARINPGLFADNQAQQIGKGLQQVGGEAARIALDMQQQANQVRIDEAMNKAVQAKLKHTYDPEAGFVHLKGDAALTRPDKKPLDVEYGEKLKADLDAIEQGLGNNAQRQAFRQQAGQLARQFQGSVTQHLAQEFRTYQASVYDGTIATAADQMALSWGDPEALKQGQDAIKAAAYAKGKLAGLSGKAIEAATVDALSPAHAAVIASAIDADNLDYAREYMRQVNAELTPAARLQLAKTLDAGDFEKRTQEKADELYAKHGGDTAAALKEVRETLSGKDEDAVVTRIKTLDAERVTLREREQKDAADQAWRVYSQTGGLGRIPASVLAGMDGRDLEALRRTARADAEARVAKSEVKTDPSVYYALTIASAQDAGNFAKEDLHRYFDKLSPSDRKHFIDLQGKALKPGESEQITTAAQQKAATVKALELKGAEAGVFMQQADKALLAAQQEKGSTLNQAERQKVLDGLVLEGRVPGNWFGTNDARAFEAQAQGKPFTPEWNDAQVRKATAALQRQGIKQPTKQQIEATLRAAYGVQ